MSVYTQFGTWLKVNMLFSQSSSRLSVRCVDMDQRSSASTCSLTQTEPSQLHDHSEDHTLNRTLMVVFGSSRSCDNVSVSFLSSSLTGGKCKKQVNTVSVWGCWAVTRTNPNNYLLFIVNTQTWDSKHFPDYFGNTRGFSSLVQDKRFETRDTSWTCFGKRHRQQDRVCE